jgi:cell wall-associated NlpC family hydrolase
MVPPSGRHKAMPALPAVAGVAALLAGAAGTLGLVTVAATTTQANEALPACVSSGPIAGLSPSQAQNARTIVAVARQREGDQAALIALMVGLAESDLRVLANPNDPSGDAYPNQGVGHDHDSLGLFQQRPGWGTAAERMSPTASTNLFLDALIAVPNWRAMTPWNAAQMVQRSAFTGTPTSSNRGSTVVGGNYLARAGRAASILATIDGGPQPDCGAAPLDVLEPGAAAAHGLPETYAIPPSTSAPARAAVAFALAQLGKPYQWGGNGPGAFDCSGLTQQAWARGGVGIGRVVGQQLADGTPTTIGALQPGDLVMIPGSLGTLARPGHVGMYIGNGLVVNAPRTGDVVRIVTLRSFINKGLAGLRHIS